MREWWRYLLAGGFNTLATYVLYLLLLGVLDYRLAYVLSFATGVVLSFVLLRYTVFARPGQPFAFLWVSASHVLQLALGLFFVYVWVSWLRGPQWAAPLASAAVCMPLMFVVQRWIFTPTHPYTVAADKWLRRACIALPLLMLTANVLCWLRWSTGIPFLDDWRAFNEGQSTSLAPQRLFKAVNNTISPIGLALDAMAQRWLDSNPLPYQTLSMLAVLGSVLWLQWKLLGWVLHHPMWQALAFVLTIFMLQSDTYWGAQNLAYHQGLPLPALLGAAWLNFALPLRKRFTRNAGVLFLGFFSGLSYVSGAFGALMMGGAWLALAPFVRAAALKRRCIEGGFWMLLPGVLTTALQLWQTHKPDATWMWTPLRLAYPHEKDFWLFAAGVFGRASGLAASNIILEALWVALLLFMLLCAVLFAVRGTKAPQGYRSQRLAVVWLPVVSVLMVYLALVSFGRAGLYAQPLQPAAEIFRLGTQRFHFFWLTLLWPWLAAAAALALRRSATSALLFMMPLVLVAATVRGVFDVPAHYRRASAFQTNEIRCIARQLGSDRPVQCAGYQHVNMPDFTRAYLHARAQGASFVRYFPLVEREGFGREMLRLEHGEGAWQLVQNAENGWMQGEGESHQLLSPPGAEDCQVIGLQVTMQTRHEGTTKLYYRHLGQAEFDEMHSVRKHYDAGDVELEFAMDNPGGFEPAIRFHPLTGDGAFRIERIRVSCLLPKEMP